MHWGTMVIREPFKSAVIWTPCPQILALYLVAASRERTEAVLRTSVLVMPLLPLPLLEPPPLALQLTCPSKNLGSEIVFQVA
nr:hypothetical protein BgiMline_005226 [Biomphalaria glabrata]